MSVDQPTLTDFAGMDDAQPTDEPEPAHGDVTPAYGTPEQECLNPGCRNDVPDGVARVMGDNDGCVPGCPECVPGVSQWFKAIERARGVTAEGQRP